MKKILLIDLFTIFALKKKKELCLPMKLIQVLKTPVLPNVNEEEAGKKNTNDAKLKIKSIPSTELFFIFHSLFLKIFSI